MIVQHDAAPGKIAILVANKSRKRKGFQKEPCTKKPSAAYFAWIFKNLPIYLQKS